MSDTMITIPLGSETADDWRAALASKCCPACGGAKLAYFTLCWGCFERIPPPLLNALHDDEDAGYEAGYRRALEAIGVRDLHVPAPPATKTNGHVDPARAGGVGTTAAGRGEERP